MKAGIPLFFWCDDCGKEAMAGARQESPRDDRTRLRAADGSICPSSATAPSASGRSAWIGTPSMPMSPCSASPSTWARNIARAPASGRGPSARPRRCSRSATAAPTTTRTTPSICRSTQVRIVDVGDADIIHTDTDASHANAEMAVRKILAARRPAGRPRRRPRDQHSLHPRLQRARPDPYRADRRASRFRRCAPRRALRPRQSDAARGGEGACDRAHADRHPQRLLDRARRL